MTKYSDICWLLGGQNLDITWYCTTNQNKTLWHSCLRKVVLNYQHEKSQHIFMYQLPDISRHKSAWMYYVRRQWSMFVPNFVRKLLTWSVTITSIEGSTPVCGQQACLHLTSFKVPSVTQVWIPDHDVYCCYQVPWEIKKFSNKCIWFLIALTWLDILVLNSKIWDVSQQFLTLSLNSHFQNGFQRLWQFKIHSALPQS